MASVKPVNGENPYFDMSDVRFAERANFASSSTAITWSNSDASVSITGSGFSFNSDGMITAGTITSIYVDGGETTGLRISYTSPISAVGLLGPANL